MGHAVRHAGVDDRHDGHGHAAGGLGSTREEAQRLRDALLFEDGIEVPVHAYRDRLRARISAQVYNDMDDIERLADAICCKRVALTVRRSLSTKVDGYTTRLRRRPGVRRS